MDLIKKWLKRIDNSICFLIATTLLLTCYVAIAVGLYISLVLIP